MNASLRVGLVLLAAAASPESPPVVDDSDLQVFPPYETVILAREQAFQRMQRLDRQRDPCNHYLTSKEWEYYHYAYMDQYNRWFVWDDLKLAYEYKGEARLAILIRLRDRLGQDRYYRGAMPECVLAD